MGTIEHIPKRLEELLGREGTDEFVDFLNRTFEAGSRDMMTASESSFENTLLRETGKIHLGMMELRSDLRGEMADLRSSLRGDMADLRSSLRGNMADLRSELREEMANLRSEFKGEMADLKLKVQVEISNLRKEFLTEFVTIHREIASIHKEISHQTKWLLGAMLAAVTLLPLLERLAVKLLP